MTTTAGTSAPKIGIGFRLPIRTWTLSNLSQFDVLEITVDHYIHGGDSARAAIRELVGEIPLVGHGVGLSIGTDVPLDEKYAEQLGQVIDELKFPFFSEHLALTKVPGIDLANLLPLPKNEQVAEKVIKKIERLKRYISVPFHLENISYLFDYPDSLMDDAQFLGLICREAGVGIHLDVENLRVNSINMGVDALAFLDALPKNSVACVHVAGSPSISRDYLDSPAWVDGHSHPVCDEMLDLLAYALRSQNPETIVLERDDRMHSILPDGGEGTAEIEEILPDLARIRACVAASDG